MFEKRNWYKDHTLKSGKTARRTKACSILAIKYNNATSYFVSEHKGCNIKVNKFYIRRVTNYGQYF
jgi:hypothetical protein